MTNKMGDVLTEEFVRKSFGKLGVIDPIVDEVIASMVFVFQYSLGLRFPWGWERIRMNIPRVMLEDICRGVFDVNSWKTASDILGIESEEFSTDDILSFGVYHDHGNVKFEFKVELRTEIFQVYFDALLTFHNDEEAVCEPYAIEYFSIPRETFERQSLSIAVAFESDASQERTKTLSRDFRLQSLLESTRTVYNLNDLDKGPSFFLCCGGSSYSNFGASHIFNILSG